MNVLDSPDDDLLAGEYVLGTLAGAERDGFARRLSADLALRAAVTRWENRLQPLADGLGPVEPSVRVWRGVARRLGFKARPPSWFGIPLAAWATAAIVVTIGVLLAPPVQQRLFARPDLTMVIGSEEHPQLWTIVADTRRNEIRITAVSDVPSADDRSLELWLLRPGEQAPVSLGLMPTVADGTRRVKTTTRLRDGVGFAVSLEPRGGSPTSVPTGPILYVRHFPT